VCRSPVTVHGVRLLLNIGNRKVIGGPFPREVNGNFTSPCVVAAPQSGTMPSEMTGSASRGFGWAKSAWPAILFRLRRSSAHGDSLVGEDSA
jgi:hypothetical protein